MTMEVDTMIEFSPAVPLFAADHSTLVVATVLIVGGVGGLAAWLAWPGLRRASSPRRDK
jgi:hypothetical protein